MVDKKELYSKKSGNTCGSEAPAISSAWRKVWLPVCCAHWESRWTWLPERLWCWGSWYPFNWFDGHEQRLFWVILGWVLFSCLRLVVWVALRLSMLDILFSAQIQTGSQNFSNQLNTNFFFYQHVGSHWHSTSAILLPLCHGRSMLCNNDSNFYEKLHRKVQEILICHVWRRML